MKVLFKNGSTLDLTEKESEILLKLIGKDHYTIDLYKIETKEGIKIIRVSEIVYIAEDK